MSGDRSARTGRVSPGTAGDSYHSDMSRTLSEADSKALLSRHGIPFAPEEVVTDPESAVGAARRLGMPVAAKLCGDNIAHKTERGLVRLGLGTDDEVRTAAADLLAAARPEDEATGVLVAPMISGDRELIAGVATDPQFGATVLLGPRRRAGRGCRRRLRSTGSHHRGRRPGDDRRPELPGAPGGVPRVTRGRPRGTGRDPHRTVRRRGSDAADDERLVSADLNPLIVHEGRPVAVDALVELSAPADATSDGGTSR